eukprot:23525-Chlamydomonas_euryale.AAC.4
MQVGCRSRSARPRRVAPPNPPPQPPGAAPAACTVSRRGSKRTACAAGALTARESQCVGDRRGVPATAASPCATAARGHQELRTSAHVGKSLWWPQGGERVPELNESPSRC